MLDICALTNVLLKINAKLDALMIRVKITFF